MHTLCACWLVLQAQQRLFMIGTLRADRTRDKSAATGWTDIFQNGFNAFFAIGAFISANARLCRMRRQIAVTPFAVRSKFQHVHFQMKIMGVLPVPVCLIRDQLKHFMRAPVNTVDIILDPHIDPAIADRGQTVVA